MVDFSKLVNSKMVKEPRVVVKGWWIRSGDFNDKNGEWRDIEVGIRHYDNHYLKGPSVQLYGGPTGYESMMLDSFKEHKSFMEKSGGWWACAGTPGKWPALLIPAEELKRALKELGHEV